MTLSPDPASPRDDPQRLLETVRDLTRRVRRDQGAGWFALLVFAGVTFLAAPFYRYGPHLRHCTPPGHLTAACTVYPTFALWYWPAALVLAYVAIAWFCLRRSQLRGVGTRVQPYLAVGVVLGLLAVVWLAWALAHPTFLAESLRLGSSEHGSFVFRITSPAGAIGLALLVLSWIERAWLLAAVTLVYLVAVGGGAHARTGRPSPWVFLPHLLLVGGILLVGAGILALVRRHSQPPTA